MNANTGRTRAHRAVKGTACAVVIALVWGCGGSTSVKPVGALGEDEDRPTTPRPAQDAEELLETSRFTVHQPRVLEQIGAHHAYARSLTGEGVTIGIEDSIVDWTQTSEFGSRVELDADKGAVLAYWRPFASIGFGTDVDACVAAVLAMTGECAIENVDSTGKSIVETINEAVTGIVAGPKGWPTRDDSLFIQDSAYEATNPSGWWEVTNPYSGENWHGTSVASTAAGEKLGVAPGATLIPIARNFNDREPVVRLQRIMNAVSVLPENEQAGEDDDWAGWFKESYRPFDIINRSFGLDGRRSSRAVFDAWAQSVKNVIPKTWEAYLQTAVADDDKTIVVYAAGNEGHPEPDEPTSFPYYLVEARGWSLAVVGTDPSTRQIADIEVNGTYDSDRCGPTPSDWNATQHGPHFCLAAPGAVRGLMPDPRSPGSGQVRGMTGTSFAAPIVAGSLALMMEHFRGTRGNTAIVKRMLDTADRTGVYADLEVYGAGHLDLEAALNPVGQLTAGQLDRPLSGTRMRVPGAYGPMDSRLAGLELASFDSQQFPFWTPVSTIVSTARPERSASPILGDKRWTREPGPGLEALGFAWTPIDATHGPGEAGTSQWVAGFGAGGMSLARRGDGDEVGYGLSWSAEAHLGAHASGAFGSSPGAMMVWTTKSVETELVNKWTLRVNATLAFSGPWYDAGAVFSASPSIMSAASARIGTRSNAITLEQPLRAESGTGTFRLENGHLRDGRRRYDEHRVALRPNARELRVAVRHDRELARGRLAIEVATAFDAYHTPGRKETTVGMAYEKKW